MSRGLFPSTRSAVLDLASDDPDRRARSLDAITRTYWQPVNNYIRVRWGAKPEDAADLTQSFFALAIDREMLAGYEPGRSRFRTFLRTCLDRHVIDQHRRRSAHRRDGGIPLELADAERELVDRNPASDPHAVFEAEWLRQMLQLAIERLDIVLAAEGKQAHAALFREFHITDAPPSYAEAAARHNVSVSNVTNWLHAARRRFRQVALELLAEITLDDDDFAAEAQLIFGIDVRAEPTG